MKIKVAQIFIDRHVNIYSSSVERGDKSAPAGVY